MTRLICFLHLLAAIASILSTPQADKITNVSGVNSAFRQYSGFLNGSSDGNIQLHYWFHESQNDPSQDPLVLWFNGGPGCSSWNESFLEHEPLLVESNGKFLQSSSYDGNQFANMLYIGSPVCVGTSSTNNRNCTDKDEEAADQSYHALLHFLSKYPELKGRHMFVTGEIYGGTYVPTLTKKIVSQPNAWINFIGFAIGNGGTSYELPTNSANHFALFPTFLNKTLFQNLINVVCPNKLTLEESSENYNELGQKLNEVSHKYRMVSQYSSEQAQKNSKQAQKFSRLAQSFYNKAQRYDEQALGIMSNELDSEAKMALALMSLESSMKALEFIMLSQYENELCKDNIALAKKCIWLSEECSALGHQYKELSPTYNELGQTYSGLRQEQSKLSQAEYSVLSQEYRRNGLSEKVVGVGEEHCCHNNIYLVYTCLNNINDTVLEWIGL